MKRILSLWAGLLSAVVLGAELTADGVYCLPGQQVAPEGLNQPNDGWKLPERLQRPYVSTYYVRPTVFAGERQAISFYVTDFHQAEVRFRDNSARFDVRVRATCDGTNWVSRMVTDLPSGDGTADLGVLPAGEWSVGVTAKDRRTGRVSRTVWQEFRVVPKDALEVPADKTYRMTEADLKAYGIRNDGDYGRLVGVDVGTNTFLRTAERTALADAGHAFLDAWLQAHPHRDDAKRPGYAIYVPTADGVPVDNAWRTVRIVFDRGYDAAQVATNAVATSDGLQKLLDDRFAAGYRRFVFLPGTYRLSAKRTLALPDRTVVDLNGAVLKLDGCTGAQAMMVKFPAVTDTVLENGTIEGDYYEHDYEHSSHSSEWVHGFLFASNCRYARIRNVTIRNITGYGGTNRHTTDGPGKWLCFEPDDCNGKNIIDLQKKANWQVGTLRADGTLDASETNVCTSAALPLDGFAPYGWVQVCRPLGQGGIGGRSWDYRIAFYDASGACLASEIACQYRIVRLPAGAKTARLALVWRDLEEARKTALWMTLMKVPVNCSVENCRFDRCRCVGYALDGCLNFCLRGNEFTRSGEALATCAFDSEDGGAFAQNAYLVGNDFHDNRRNELLTVGGLDFTLEGNRAKIHLYPWTNSTCVRSNDCTSLSVLCYDRKETGYVRIEGNRYRNALILGGEGRRFGDWFVAVDGLRFDPGTTSEKFLAASGATGLFRDCTFERVANYVGNAERCVFRDCGFRPPPAYGYHGSWIKCRAEGGRMCGNICRNVYVDCDFKDVRFGANSGEQHLLDCRLENAGFSTFFVPGKMTGSVERCTLVGKCVFPKCMTIRKD